MMVLPSRLIRIARAAGAGTTALGIGSNALIVKVGQGVFFADGHFIQSNAQDVFVPAIDSITGGYRDFDNPSNSLGYSITREYVSSDQDAFFARSIFRIQQL